MATEDDEDEQQIGRPTEYDPAFVGQVQKLCLLGATDADIADFFGVTDRTIYRWKAKYEDFCQAIKTGKAECDERVERSLYHRSVGYTFDAEKVFANGRRMAVKEHVPPDTTAMIFWLKNRRPDLWRDVRKVEAGKPGDFDALNDLSDRELAVIARGGSGDGVAAPKNGPRKPDRVH